MKGDKKMNKHVHISDLSSILLSINSGDTVTFSVDEKLAQPISLRIGVESYPPGTELSDFALYHPNCQNKSCKACPDVTCILHKK